MKRRLARFGLLGLIFACSISWVALLSLSSNSTNPGGAGTGAVNSNGNTVSVSFIDQVTFPLVTVYLQVKDSAGKTIANLQRGDFHVTEDGMAAQIVDFIGAGDQPITAILVIDHSGSMAQEGKIDGAKQAATTFLDNLRPDRDTIGVIAFSSTADQLGALHKVSQADITQLKGSVSNLIADGGTELYNTILSAMDQLSGISGRRSVIILTDGLDNAQGWWILDQSKPIYDKLLKTSKEKDITLYTIGLGSDVDTARLTEIAQNSGGEYYFAPSAAVLSDLYRRIATGLQSEYSLSYNSPTPKLDGTRRQVQVTSAISTGSITAPAAYSVGGVLTANVNPLLLFGLLLPLVALLAIPPVFKLVRRTLAVPQPEVASANESPVAYVQPSPMQAVGSPIQGMERIAPSAPAVAQDMCPKCHAALGPNAKFCQQCGHNPNLCPHCGTQLSRRGAAFCGKCGARLGE